MLKFIKNLFKRHRPVLTEVKFELFDYESKLLVGVFVHMNGHKYSFAYKPELSEVEQIYRYSKRVLKINDLVD